MRAAPRLFIASASRARLLFVQLQVAKRFCQLSCVAEVKFLKFTPSWSAHAQAKVHLDLLLAGKSQGLNVG